MDGTMRIPCTDRDEAIRRIGAALKARSGKAWSVTGGRGTAWGWITIQAPPKRRTWSHRLKAGAPNDYPENWEGFDSGEPGHRMTPSDCAELAQLLKLPIVHGDGVSIPAAHDYRTEYVDRAEGRDPSVTGAPYWD